MVNKISHIVISLLLLMATTGMAVSRHYCSGSLISSTYFGVAKSCCNDGDCCHNENHFFKVNADFSASEVQDLPQLAESDIPGVELLYSPYPDLSECNDLIEVFKDLPPPPKIEVVLALNQSYLL